MTAAMNAWRDARWLPDYRRLAHTCKAAAFGTRLA
jgi:hypothetical protein